MSKEPIIGSGFKGAEFEEKGLKERNLNNLLELLGTKKVSESIDKLSKIRPENWERLAEATQAIIETAGALDPNIVSQVATTVTDYVGARFDAMIANLLAPYLPAIFDALNNYVFPVVDGIFNSMTIGFGEIFSGFAGIRGMIAARQVRVQEERVRRFRQKFYREVFFPEMDILYAERGGEGFMVSERPMEQLDLRRGSTTAAVAPAAPDPNRWIRLEED